MEELALWKQLMVLYLDLKHAYKEGMSSLAARAFLQKGCSDLQVPSQLCATTLLGDSCRGARLPAMHSDRNILLLPGTFSVTLP